VHFDHNVFPVSESHLFPVGTKQVHPDSRMEVTLGPHQDSKESELRVTVGG
jgi:hypothetical protein